MRSCVIGASLLCLTATGCSWIYDPDKLPAMGDGSVERAPDADRRDTGVGIIPFPYTPSNFVADEVMSVRNVVVDCAMAFDTSGAMFTAVCPERPPPEVFEVAQTEGGPDVVVLAMASLDITSAGSLKLVGDRPVIIAVRGSATIAGPIDGSADHPVPGPGGAALCSPGEGQAGTSGNSAGGGGGGTYGGVGEDGGASAQGTNGGAARNMPLGNANLVPLRAGCAGGVGGTSPSADGGAAGAAGGAVQISVAGTLTVTSFLSVGGGGGTGGIDSDGGGGGGSGGGLLLEAESLSIGAGGGLLANGGAGGEGGANGIGCTVDGAPRCDDGDDGADDSKNPALGGAQVSLSAGNGGDGATVDSVAKVGQPGSSSAGGGGGGGGGIGFIRINSPSCSFALGAIYSGALSSGRDGCL